MTDTLGILASGERVVDRPDSHVATHKTVCPLLRQALGCVYSHWRDNIVEEIDFDRIVGETICVETTRDDVVVYARRPNRAGHTRFVKYRSARPCSTVVVVLRRLQRGVFELRTAYIGRSAPLEPWDLNATEESFAFWETHALVWGCEETILGTETPICPWHRRRTTWNSSRQLPRWRRRFGN